MEKGSSTDRPLISVIIPTYNKGWCIKKAIDSMLFQSYQNFEIILVDGGSTDNTQDLVQNIDDRRVRCYKFSSRTTVETN